MLLNERVGALVALSALSALAFACSSEIGTGVPNAPGSGSTGSGATGGTSSPASGGMSSVGSGGSTSGSAGNAIGGSAGSAMGGSAGSAVAAGAGGSAGSVPLSTGGVKLRLLTQAEYRASLKSLFGNITTTLDLPEDTSVGGFISIGAAQITVNSSAADKYEVASNAVVAEVFGDMSRWQTLVGCQPQANLSDTCVETFVRTFGGKAFRRDLTDAEFQQWVQVARSAATQAGTAAWGLQTLTSGLLQSPNFLYRVETNALDPANGRLKYDGPSMAVRLAFFLTGGPPSAELLAAGESGQLDTADGVRTAVASMLNDPALVGLLTGFFYEYTMAERVMIVEKSPDLFPEFTDSLRASMKEGTRLFLEKVVLAPGADVRRFFDSDQTFADAKLAPIYGVTAPNSGFGQFTLAPESGRAGIMGQAGMIAAHSKPDHSSPTARGVFMLTAFLCTVPDPPPAGVDTTLTVDPTLTTRQVLEEHRKNPSCAGCHAQFDPLGMALEHFDSIGRYRELEGTLPIDATGELEDGTTFDGAVEFGKAFGASPAVTECLLRNFYRSANGRQDDLSDKPQVDAMMASLNENGFVFRDFVSDFVASDAFRYAPALPLTGETP